MRTKAIELSKKESYEVAEFAHSEFLRALSLSDKVETADIVFHGGTSLKIMHQSPRYSEDLDFMIKKESTSLFNNALPLIVKDVERIMMIEYPNIKIDWVSKIKPETSMITGTMRIKSPDWHRDVRVKVECYPAQDMTDYVYSNMDIDSSSDLVLPTATLDSIMGDKIVALAMRPYFKERDAYDVWWMTKKGIEPSLESMERSCAVYGYDPEHVLEKLSFIDERMGSSEVLQKDLKKWLSPELHAHFSKNDIFEAIRQTTLDACQSLGM